MPIASDAFALDTPRRADLTAVFDGSDVPDQARGSRPIARLIIVCVPEEALRRKRRASLLHGLTSASLP